jgi:hypothetical protein
MQRRPVASDPVEQPELFAAEMRAAFRSLRYFGPAQDHQRMAVIHRFLTMMSLERILRTRPSLGRLTRLGRRIARNSAEFALRLSSWRFHERHSGQSGDSKKPLKTMCFQGPYLVAGIGFEPMTFRL